MVLVYYKIIFRKGPHFKHVFFSFLKITLFIFLFLAMLGLYCCAGFSLVVESGGYSLVAVQRLLTKVTSLVTEHGSTKHGLSSFSSWALEPRLTNCGAWA